MTESLWGNGLSAFEQKCLYPSCFVLMPHSKNTFSLLTSKERVVLFQPCAEIPACVCLQPENILPELLNEPGPVLHAYFFIPDILRIKIRNRLIELDALEKPD